VSKLGSSDGNIIADARDQRKLQMNLCCCCRWENVNGLMQVTRRSQWPGGGYETQSSHVIDYAIKMT